MCYVYVILPCFSRRIIKTCSIQNILFHGDFKNLYIRYYIRNALVELIVRVFHKILSFWKLRRKDKKNNITLRNGVYICVS